MDGRGAVTSSGHAVLTYVADISGHTFRANDCGAAGMEYIWDFGSGRLRQIGPTVIGPRRTGELIWKLIRTPGKMRARLRGRRRIDAVACVLIDPRVDVGGPASHRRKPPLQIELVGCMLVLTRQTRTESERSRLASCARNRIPSLLVLMQGDPMFSFLGLPCSPRLVSGRLP